MNRNDKCFCGSGIKYKRCHGNVEENSVVGELIKFNNKLDSKIISDIKNNSKKVICKKGCSECCYQNFVITEGEFALIIDFLVKKKGREYTESIIKEGLELNNKIKESFPDYYDSLEEDITGKPMENLKSLLCAPDKNKYKCVFLDDEGSCSIYEVRPIICRHHGVSYLSNMPDYKMCSKIVSVDKNKSNMVNVDEELKDQSKFESFPSKNFGIATRRRYPIFYFIKVYFKDDNLDCYLNHPVQRLLFRCDRVDFMDRVIDLRNSIKK